MEKIPIYRKKGGFSGNSKKEIYFTKLLFFTFRSPAVCKSRSFFKNGVACLDRRREFFIKLIKDKSIMGLLDSKQQRNGTI